MSNDTNVSPSAAPPGGRHQRRLRNYLLDPRFQLKYTSYLVAVAVLLVAVLGGVLFWADQSMQERNQALLAQSAKVLEEGKKVSKVVGASVEKSAAGDPALAELFQMEEADYTKQLAAQNVALQKHAEYVQANQRIVSIVLVSALVLFLVVIALAGIYVTHKIAGPIYKMKRQLGDVARGQLRVPSELRKGDELVDFFNAFSDMVKALRRRQEIEIAQLDEAIAAVKAGGGAEAIGQLDALRENMRAALDV